MYIYSFALVFVLRSVRMLALFYFHLCMPKTTFLQLIVAAAALAAQIREVHDLDNHAGPAGEVLDTLTLAVVGVVLLESETRVLPFLEDVLDQVLAQLGVHGCCALLMGAGLLGDVLFCC